MKTIYIDVYFMINFTVDILAIFIASRMTHVNVTIKRLVLSGACGALFAIAELFIKTRIADIGALAIFLLIISFVVCKSASPSRKLKFLLSFYIAAFLISGSVDFVYGILDRYTKDMFSQISSPTNRKAIVFSLIILLVIGALRLIIMMFSDAINEKTVRLRIELHGKFIEVDALVDTGNLVKDPMNMNPVIFLKKSGAKEIIPASVIDLSDIDSLSTDFRKRIRLIPVSRNSETHVMTGVRVDRVMIVNEKHCEEINATIVIDKEEGTYGGYYALAPHVTTCNNG